MMSPSSGFVLRSEASLGPFGALVFPKLFRRAMTFFHEARRGMSFLSWLRDESGVDDEVRIHDGPFRHLSSALREHGGQVQLAADVLAMTFAEG